MIAQPFLHSYNQAYISLQMIRIRSYEIYLSKNSPVMFHYISILLSKLYFLNLLKNPFFTSIFHNLRKTYTLKQRLRTDFITNLTLRLTYKRLSL